MLGYLTTEVGADAGDELRYKFPYLAYEVFSCELTEIIDVVFDTPGLLAKFMEFIDKDDELDSLLVGYFCNILIILMRKRPTQSEAYFVEHTDAIDKLLRHSTSLCVAGMWVNILGAGMQVDAPLLPVEFLLEQKIITRLVHRIGPPAGPDGRASASLILEGLLQNGYCSEFPDAPTAPLVEELKGAECTEKLVQFCMDESEPTQLHAMAVLSALLEMLRDEPSEFEGLGGGGDRDAEEDEGAEGGDRYADGGSTGSELLGKLAGQGEVFAAALKKPAGFGGCVLTFGEVPETLGSKRLALIQFLLVLLRSRSGQVAEMFVVRTSTFVFKMVDFALKNGEVCIKNNGFCRRALSPRRLCRYSSRCRSTTSCTTCCCRS